MAADAVPAVPIFRRDRGPEWAKEWRRAHREMGPYGRRPDSHLIDQILQEPERAWLRHCYPQLADMTIARDGFEQANGRTRWTKRLLDPTTMSLRNVAVILDSDGSTIITAFSR